MTIDRAIEILDPEHREHYDSLDEVNEACRMGMEALKRTRWTPCNKRMPPQTYDVLVWDEIDGEPFMGHYNKYDGWDILGFNYPAYEFNITHWMPLPKPPEEDNK